MTTLYGARKWIQARANPLRRHLTGQTLPCADNLPPQQKATAADGTHPTGMHSCSNIGPDISMSFGLLVRVKTDTPTKYH